MSCERFEECLDDFLEGRLSDVEQRAAEEHLAGCEPCSTLVATVRATLGILDPTVAPGIDADLLASNIVVRTSGPGCSAAHALLPDHIGGLLSKSEARLVESHLQHCPRCAALRTTLAWVATELPSLAVLDPDAAFTADVVRLTSGAPASPVAALDRWRAAVIDAYRHLVARPRFAWEAAYVATLAIVLLCGTTASPFRAVPQRALAVVQVDPRGAATGAAQQLRSLHDGIGAAGQAAWNATGNRTANGVRGQVSIYADRHPGMHEAWSGFELHGHDLRGALGSRNLASAGLIMRAMWQDAADLWRIARTQNAAPPAEAATP